MSPFAVRILVVTLVVSVAAVPVEADGGSAGDPIGVASEASRESRLVLRLDSESVGRAGLETMGAEAARLAPEVMAYGRVLDPNPVIAAVAQRRAARAVSVRAEKELRRIRELARDEQNASERDLDAARVEASRASADLEIAEAGVVGVFGVAPASDPGLDSLMNEITRHVAALIRVDVPANSPRPDPRQGVTISSHPERTGALAVEYLGAAPVADPGFPGWGFLFVAREDPPPAGTPVSAWIRTTGSEMRGVDLPAEALVRHGGRIFVFVKRGEGEFERRSVDARSRGAGRWFITRGVQPGDEVVVAGAQQLLSAQLIPSSAAEEQ
jgi:hypothetical protein